MADRFCFNPGRLPGTFQFHATPQRLMAGDIHVIITGGHRVGDTLRVAVDRSLQLNLLAADFATQWRRNGKFIPWENERTYTIRPEDAGCTIDCLVTDAAGLVSEAVGVE